jgi:hypothetical protein
MTKVIAPLAGHMADLAIATTHFLSSLQEGTEANVASELVDINEQISTLNKAIEDNATASGRAKNALLGFTDGTSTDNNFMREQIELLKQRRAILMEQLSQMRTGTSGLIDTSAPFEMEITSSNNLRNVIVSNSEAMIEAQKAWDKMLKEGTLGMTEYVDTSTEIAKKAQKAWDEMRESGTLGVTSFVDTSGMMEDQFIEASNGAISLLSSIQRLSDEGSSAYKDLERAIMAVNIAQSAVSGNIAGAVASSIGLLMSLDNDLGGDISAEVQASQNLDAWGEKADSISKSVDITASATEKLVGINTKMLDALKTVQSGITGASGIIARDNTGASVNVGNLGIMSNLFTDNKIGGLLMKGFDIFNKVTFNFLGSLTSGLFKSLGSILGGKSKVTDEGIRIIGGRIEDLTENITVQAFQSIKYKKWKFGSTKRKTKYQGLSSAVENQFSLVFDSIIDSVASGAELLGISQKEIDDAISGFVVGTTKLSLKGLSRASQQKEIEAYFSRVFNGLALRVIPFIGEFQQAGEELGETLSRVATQVSIMEFASERLGITIASKFNDPKAFAMAADNISMLTGGVEKFAEKTGSFVNSFASDATKISIYQDSLSKSLSEVGLQLPKTANGMWQLMSSLNASTESGQAQIAALLNLTDEASAYYELLESASNRYREAALGIYEVNEAARQVSLNAALTSARMGDMSLAEGLDLSSIAPNQSDFSSLLDFQLAQADTSRKLLELADITEGQLTVEDKQLAELEKIREALSGESKQNTEESMQAMQELKYEIENLSRNTGRIQNEMSEYLEKIANGTIRVRVES